MRPRDEIATSLYTGAQRFGEIARLAIVVGDVDTKAKAIGAFVGVVATLNAHLMARSLHPSSLALQSLCAACLQRAQQASLHMQEAPLVEALAFLRRARTRLVTEPGRVGGRE